MAERRQPIQIDSAMLQHYIEALGSIGWQAGGGIVRPVYSAAWVQARGQLAAWMRAAGLDVREDSVGNLFGRLRGAPGYPYLIRRGMWSQLESDAKWSRA